MLAVLDEKQRDELATVLGNEAGNVSYIGQDTSRQVIRNRILAGLLQLGSVRSFSGSSSSGQTPDGGKKDERAYTRDEDVGLRKLLVVTVGGRAAEVGQELLKQMNTCPQSDLKVMVCCLDTALLRDYYYPNIPQQLQRLQMYVSPDDRYIYNEQAKYPSLYKMLYPGLWPTTRYSGGAGSRYHGAAAVIINHEEIKYWLRMNMDILIRQGAGQKNFSVALVISPVGATGSGSLERLMDVIAEAARDVDIALPIHTDIYILQPGRELQPGRGGVSEYGLANTLALYAELAASRLSQDGVDDKRCQGRIIMVGWGGGQLFTSIEQLEETAATLIRLLNDPVTRLVTELQEREADNHILLQLDESTSLPTHLSTATPVTISLGRLEEQIIQRDAARLINNLVFGSETPATLSNESQELFTGTLASSMPGQDAGKRYMSLVHYLATGTDIDLGCLRENFRSQILGSPPQGWHIALEGLWNSDKTKIAQSTPVMQTIGHQLIKDISNSWLKLQHDSMAASSALSLSTLRNEYQRLNNILMDVLVFARQQAGTNADDSRVMVSLKAVDEAAKVRGRRAEQDRRVSIERAVREIQINVRTHIERQANPIAIEVLKELISLYEESLRNLEAVVQHWEKKQQKMIASWTVALHPLDKVALSAKRDKNGQSEIDHYYDRVSIFTNRSREGERFTTETDQFANFRRWLAAQQNLDDLFKGDIDLLLRVAQDYTRDQVHKEVKESSVLDVLLQSGEETLPQRLGEAAVLAHPLVSFNEGFAARREEIWHVCAYCKDKDQRDILQKAMDRVFGQGRCTLLETKDPTEIVVFYYVDGLPMSAVQDLTGRCLEAFLSWRKWQNRTTSTTHPIYSGQDAEERVIQQDIICKLCRGIGKDFSNYRDLPELKDCEP